MRPETAQELSDALDARFPGEYPVIFLDSARCRGTYSLDDLKWIVAWIERLQREALEDSAPMVRA